jgi:hypothetical protein
VAEERAQCEDTVVSLKESTEGVVAVTAVFVAGMGVVGHECGS